MYKGFRDFLGGVNDSVPMLENQPPQPKHRCQELAQDTDTETSSGEGEKQAQSDTESQGDTDDEEINLHSYSFASIKAGAHVFVGYEDDCFVGQVTQVHNKNFAAISFME